MGLAALSRRNPPFPRGGGGACKGIAALFLLAMGEGSCYNNIMLGLFPWGGLGKGLSSQAGAAAKGGHSKAGRALRNGGYAMKDGRWAGPRGSSVLRSWFLSYLLVLAVPLLLCLLLYWQSYRTIRAEAEKMYSSTLEQVRIDIDAYLNEVLQVQSQMLLSDAIHTATRIGTAVTAEDQLSIVDVRDELQHIMTSHTNISSIALVLNSSDSVVTNAGYMPASLYYKLYFRSEEMTLEEFQAYMAQPHNMWDVLPVNVPGKQYLLFVRTTMDKSFSKATGTVVVAIDLSLLRKRLQQFCWDERLNLYIVAPDSSLLCRTAGEGELHTDFEDLAPTTSLRMVQNEGGSYGMLVSRSISGWRYVLLAEDSLLRQSALQIQVYTYLGLLVCMLVGLALSRQLARRNYHPLRQLLGRFSDQGDAEPPAAGNEYAQLDRYIQQFFEKRGNEQHDLWNSQQILRRYQLYTLLERPCLGRENLPEGAALVPQAAAYQVVLFTPPAEGDTTGADLLQFAVMNIFTEVAGEHYPLEMTYAGENVAAIIGLPEAADGLPGQLEEDIRFTQQKLQEYFHLLPCAAAGDAHRELAGIHYSYREALEAVSYQHAGNETDLVAYSEIRDAKSSCTLPLEEESKLIGLIAAAKNEEARCVVQQVFALNLRQGVPSASVARCLAYDILSSLVKGANLAGVNGLTVLRFVELENCQPAELPAKLCEFVDLLCEKVRDLTPAATPSRQLCEEVCAYIQQNFRDPDLNISQTGLHFDLTPAYLSALFKRETGATLLSYITQVRLDAAKELLMQGQPVARIAEQCGFRDSGTLIRVFKKATGLTPGQYRAIHSAGG